MDPMVIKCGWTINEIEVSFAKSSNSMEDFPATFARGYGTEMGLMFDMPCLRLHWWLIMWAIISIGGIADTWNGHECGNPQMVNRKYPKLPHDYNWCIFEATQVIWGSHCAFKWPLAHPLRQHFCVHLTKMAKINPKWVSVFLRPIPNSVISDLWTNSCVMW